MLKQKDVLDVLIEQMTIGRIQNDLTEKGIKATTGEINKILKELEESGDVLKQRIGNQTTYTNIAPIIFETY